MEAGSDSSSEEDNALLKDWTQLGKDKDVNFSPHIFINNKVDMCYISSISEHYDNCESGWCNEEQEKEDEHMPEPVPRTVKSPLMHTALASITNRTFWAWN